MGSARGRLQGAQQCGRQPSPSTDHSLGQPWEPVCSQLLSQAPHFLGIPGEPGRATGERGEELRAVVVASGAGARANSPHALPVPPLPQNPVITIMVSVYFQLAPLEESSFQQQLVIVLWPPADSLITWRAPRSPTLLLLRLLGVEGGSGASTGGG